MSATKTGINTTNILNCYFSKKITLWHYRLNIYICKTKFPFHKQYLFVLLFSRNAKNIHKDQSIPQVFLLCPKRNVSQTFKSSRRKKVFLKCVYHWFNLLQWMFLIPCKTLVTQRFGTGAMLLLSLKQVLWEESTIYIRYLHNNITVLLIPKVQNKDSAS